MQRQVYACYHRALSGLTVIQGPGVSLARGPCEPARCTPVALLDSLAQPDIHIQHVLVYKGIWAFVCVCVCVLHLCVRACACLCVGTVCGKLLMHAFVCAYV